MSKALLCCLVTGLRADGAEFRWEVPVIAGASSLRHAAEGLDLRVTLRLAAPRATARLRVVNGLLTRPRLALVLVLPGATTGRYLLSAGNLYDGNRAHVFAAGDNGLPNPDFAGFASAVKRDGGPIINDVIRLERTAPGAPETVRYPANLSTWPTLHLHDGRAKTLWTFTSARPEDDAYSVEIGPRETRLACEHPIQCEFSYHVGETGANTRCPPAYPEVTWRGGETVTLAVDIADVFASTLADGFALATRQAFVQPSTATAPGACPLSHAARLTEQKFNRENWDEKDGYYCIFLHAGGRIPWEIGWTGGAQIGLYQEVLGDKTTRGRFRRNLELIFGGAQTPAGFFFSNWDKGAGLSERGGNHLLRRTADALLYLTRTYVAAREAGDPLPAVVEAGLRRAATALAEIGAREDEFPQWVDQLTGATVVPGSASAAIGVAALLEASVAFHEPAWRKVALRCARTYRDRWVRRGQSGGGPTDCLQSADSESAYGLLEAMIAVAETTGKSEWIDAALSAGDQFLTWVSSRDWAIPPDSTYGKLGVGTLGAVYANLRNRHLAPGMCTYGGNALLRLSRLTGDMFYAQALSTITRALTPYQSRRERPIRCKSAKKNLPDGWINESIWVYRRYPEVDIRGEVWWGSCWPEGSLMLTCAEVPSVYIGDNDVIAFDHVTAKRRADGKVVIANPHDQVAEITVWNDTASGKTPSVVGAPRGLLWPSFTRHTIPAGGRIFYAGKISE